VIIGEIEAKHIATNYTNYYQSNQYWIFVLISIILGRKWCWIYESI